MKLDILLIAFLMTLLEGLALIMGGTVVLAFRRIKKNILPFILSFSGGIMIYAAFMKFVPHSLKQLELVYSPQKAFVVMTACFFIGIFATLPIDIVLSKVERKFLLSRHIDDQRKNEEKLFLFIFLSITIHNFFEGIATFITYLSETRIAFPVIFSLMAHNFPEGAVIAMIIFKKTQNKSKALLYCTIAAAAGPLGAISSYLVLNDIYNDTTFGMVKGILAGLLINTALDELIPSSNLKGSHKLSMKGIVAGMFFMAILMVMVYS